MAALTWRNVDAPSVNVNAGAQSGQLLAAAAKQFSDGLAGIAKQQQANTDRELLTNALRYTDAEQLQRDISSGALNLSGASAGALDSVNSLVGERLRQAVTQQSLSDARTQSERGTREYEAQRAYSPALADSINARQSGDPARIAAADQAAYQLSRELGIRDQLTAVNGIEGITDTLLSQEGRRLGNIGARQLNANRALDNQLSQVRLQTAQRDLRDEDFVQQQLQRVLTSEPTEAGRRQYLDELQAESTPRQWNAINRAVSGDKSLFTDDGKGSNVPAIGALTPQDNPALLAADEQLLRYGQREAAENATGITAAYGPALKDNRNSGEVVSELAKQFPGLDAGWAGRQLTDIQQSLGENGNPALAGAILSRSLVPQREIFGLRQPYGVNQDALDSSVAQVNTGDAANRSAANQLRSGQISSLKLKRDNLAKIEAEEPSVLARASSNPTASDDIIARHEERKAAALGDLTAAMRTTGNAADFYNPRLLTPPVPTPIVRRASGGGVSAEEIRRFNRLNQGATPSLGD